MFFAYTAYFDYTRFTYNDESLNYILKIAVQLKYISGFDAFNKTLENCRK